MNDCPLLLEHLKEINMQQADFEDGSDGTGLNAAEQPLCDDCGFIRFKNH